MKEIRLDMCRRIEGALSPLARALRKVVLHSEGLSMIGQVEAEVRRLTARLRTHAAAP